MSLSSNPKTTVPSATLSRALMASAIPMRHLRRERDFGVGYGNSSGYASGKRYTSDWPATRFRMA